MFDDQIEFVLTQQIEAKLKAKKKKKKKKRGDGGAAEDSDDSDDDGDAFPTSVAQEEEECEEDAIPEGLSDYERIRISRKKLPAYAYRDEFLSAVKDNQVIKINGEK